MLTLTLAIVVGNLSLSLCFCALIWGVGPWALWRDSLLSLFYHSANRACAVSILIMKEIKKIYCKIWKYDNLVMVLIGWPWMDVDLWNAQHPLLLPFWMCFSEFLHAWAWGDVAHELSSCGNLKRPFMHQTM